MQTRIGTCSLCGGDVMGYTGAWWSTLPPPPECASCGAVPAWASDVIPMVPRPRPTVFITAPNSFNCPGCGKFPCQNSSTGCPLPLKPAFTVTYGAVSTHGNLT